MSSYKPHLMSGMRLCRADAPAIRLVGRVPDTGEWFCVVEGEQEMTLLFRKEVFFKAYSPDSKDPATKGCLQELAEEAQEWARSILGRED